MYTCLWDFNLSEAPTAPVYQVRTMSGYLQEMYTCLWDFNLSEAPTARSVPSQDNERLNVYTRNEYMFMGFQFIRGSDCPQCTKSGQWAVKCIYKKCIHVYEISIYQRLRLPPVYQVRTMSGYMYIQEMYTCLWDFNLSEAPTAPVYQVRTMSG